MTAKHTPGPWTVRHAEEGPSRRRLFIVHDAHGKTIAENRHPHDWTEATANARLIAAAPEMLKAAKEARAALQEFITEEPASEWMAVALLDAVIAKAEGLS